MLKEEGESFVHGRGAGWGEYYVTRGTLRLCFAEKKMMSMISIDHHSKTNKEVT